MTRPQGSKCVHESGVLTWLDRSAGVSAPRRAGSAAELLDAGDLFRRRPVILIQLGTRHHPAAFRPPRRGRRTLPDHLHDLRHSYATGALKAGVSAKVVSDRFGHANVGFFLQTYAHVLGSDDREAAEQAASFLIGDGWDLAGEGAAEDDETI
jgi:integrase